MDGSSLRTRVEELLGRPLAAPPPVVTDTTQYMNIWRGHVIRLDDRHFLVERDMKEGRFGLDEEPKHRQDVSDSDVRSLGNILVYVIGKGERTFHDLRPVADALDPPVRTAGEGGAS